MKDTITMDGETIYTDYEIPKDDSVIWRFLDLAKFIALHTEIGRISYSDYSKVWPNANEALWRKWLSEYKHKVKVRLQDVWFTRLKTMLFLQRILR